MAESFTNAFVRAAGIVTTHVADIVASTNTIVGISTAGVSVGNLIDTPNFIGGTKVVSIGANTIVADSTSTNQILSYSQTVKFVGVSTVYTSTGVKSILVGGTLSNNTNNQVAATVQISSGSTSYNFLYKVPVPAGSSLILSDAGKIVLVNGDSVRVAADANNALDVSLSVLTGVA